MKVEKSTLKLLAGLVWYTGFIALLGKSFILFSEAYMLNKESFRLILIFLFTALLIWLKVKYIFLNVCQKNLKRIEALKEPKIWQFYRLRFFLFLISMISLGAYLSRIAVENYWGLMAVGVLDLSVGLSLFFSGFLFWKRD